MQLRKGLLPLHLRFAKDALTPNISPRLGVDLAYVNKLNKKPRPEPKPTWPMPKPGRGKYKK